MTQALYDLLFEVYKFMLEEQAKKAEAELTTGEAVELVYGTLEFTPKG